MTRITATERTQLMKAEYADANGSRTTGLDRALSAGCEALNARCEASGLASIALGFNVLVWASAYYLLS